MKSHWKGKFVNTGLFDLSGTRDRSSTEDPNIVGTEPTNECKRVTYSSIERDGKVRGDINLEVWVI